MASGTNSTNNTLVVKTDTDGKLRAIGNQYKYNGGVNAYHQLRNFINEPAANYYSTGYNLNVNNTVDAKGNSIFDRVEVTTPNATVLTLKPAAGSSYLPLVKGNTLTGTNFVRIRSVYTDPANSGKNPADADTTLVLPLPTAGRCRHRRPSGAEHLEIRLFPGGEYWNDSRCDAVLQDTRARNDHSASCKPNRWPPSLTRTSLL